ncbi:MAG TPA: NAD-dependent epimerase/dehydratase family protein [Dysgonomonas sp.]|uniref:NAD-dependent epimerase/dehydratase family protein n=1 Tax=unclassified Dysgonomonas TaxID=2630389 RepID=UPI0025BC9A79|nr:MULTISPECIES: NAD-dependent epimerase/dehydratase family protein [unclassified Dysgonomonas]HML65194.1 NAD-dependent epimerase/dehydratase family protein [Dysgonomonas sp.]
MKILVTGAAGFIGFSLIEKLVKEQNIEIVGIDNINDYYDINLKYSRLGVSGIKRESILDYTLINSSVYDNYSFTRIDITDYKLLSGFFDKQKFDIVINLAAQAGVRYSIENPHTYVQSNIVGFTNILECCRYHHIKHLVYASSSSVYGIRNEIPFREDDNVDYPVSFYAATKRSNELMAYTYSDLFKLPVTGVRLFTVYGPWGRPDMAPMIFAKSIFGHNTIKVYNYGNMLRDFTFIDDIVSGIKALIDKAPDSRTDIPFYQIFNIGNSQPVKLMDFINILENEIGIKAKLELLPIPKGDVFKTYADTSKIATYANYKTTTSIKEGVHKFGQWYKEYYKL